MNYADLLGPRTMEWGFRYFRKGTLSCNRSKGTNSDVSVGEFLTTRCVLWGHPQDNWWRSAARQWLASGECQWWSQNPNKKTAETAVALYVPVHHHGCATEHWGWQFCLGKLLVICSHKIPIQPSFATRRIAINSVRISYVSPAVPYDATYSNRSWLWLYHEVYILDPVERLRDYLRAFYCREIHPIYHRRLRSLESPYQKGENALWTSLHWPPRCARCVGVLTQNIQLYVERPKTRWLAMFQCKDRDSFEDVLRENGVIPSRDERAAVHQLLAETKHAKRLMKTDSASRL